MARDQEEGFLPAHAASERVDPAAVDPDPRQLGHDDVRHPRQVVDLSGEPVGERLQAPAIRRG